MNELRIIFEGVMAIGPAPPRSSNAPQVLDGSLFAVMPKVTRHESRYSKFNHPNPRLYVPAHVPVIYTNLTPLSGSREQDDKIGDFKLWYPIRERMELRFSPSADPNHVQYLHQDLMIGDQIYAIDKIADIRDIWPQRSRLRKGMLRKQPPVAEIVASQVFVPSGYVGSRGEFNKETPQRSTFLPPKTSKPHEMDLLPHVVVKVHTDQVNFAMYSLDTGEQLDSIAFRVTDPQKPNVIRIANGDPINIRYVIDGLMGSHDEPTGLKPTADQVLKQGKNKEPSKGDIDFENGYDILAGYDDDDGKEVPIPWEPLQVGDSNCHTHLADPPSSGE